MSEKVPPIGTMQSVDLITEGVLTIQETVNLIEDYLDKRKGQEIFEDNNGASILANLLMNHCTHIDFVLGNSINPAH
ncbi:MAG: serine/threonine-protein phosphatase, partial [Eubacterium sp.]